MVCPSKNKNPFHPEDERVASAVPPQFADSQSALFTPDHHPDCALTGLPVPFYSPNRISSAISPNDFSLEVLRRFSAIDLHSLAAFK